MVRSTTTKLPHNCWILAAQTPPESNRFVEFLRVVSICLVILGDWLRDIFDPRLRGRQN